MKSFIMPEVKMEKIQYPKEDVEFIVGQIIRLENESGHTYAHNIDQTITILNESLKQICKPIIYFGGKENGL